LGRVVDALAPHPRGLCGEGVADPLAVDFGADEGAHHRFFLLGALLARPSCGFQLKKGEAGSSTSFSMYSRRCGWLSFTV